MNKVTYRVTLDLKKPGVQHTIYAKRNDARSREVVFTLRAGSKAYSIDESTTAYLYATADGAEIFSDCEISGSMITVPLTTNILNAKNILLELRLTDGTGAVLTTPQVKVVSEEALYSEEAITATDDFSALLNAITAAENSRIVDITAEENILTITYADGTSVSVELNITVEGGGGISFEAGNALELTDEDVLNVVTTDDVSKGNTLPITSNGVALVEEAIRKDIPSMPDIPVKSVNGKTGAVILNADDVGARPSNWMPTAEQVGALPEGTTIPSKTTQLTNDSGFITKAVTDLTNYYTKSQTLTKNEINALISAIPKFAISVVTSLPTSNISATTVYLVKSGTGNDLYTEYIYVNGAWEILGAQKLDLTGYATETWVKEYAQPIGDYLLESELQTAIDSALAEAKASGEFDGEDGRDGADGFSPTVAVSSITSGHRITITDKNDTKTVDVMDGSDGEDGADGVSVSSVVQTTTSSADGGTNVITVTLSNGAKSTFNVKNGSKGYTGDKGLSIHYIDERKPTINPDELYEIPLPHTEGYQPDDLLLLADQNIYQIVEISGGYALSTLLFSVKGEMGLTGAPGENGKDGTSVTVSKVTESTADGGSNIVTFSDGNTLTVKNGSKGSAGDNGEDGADGADGERGFSVLRITTAPTAYTTATGGFTPAYRIALSTVKSQASVDKVLVGDTILRNYYTYQVGYVDSSYVYLSSYASIRGSAGAAGKTAYAYAQDGGYTGTEAEFAAKLAEVYSSESWTFTLEDGSTVTKKVVLA